MRLYPNAVIGHGEEPIILRPMLARHAHVHPRRALPAKLDGVADQVLKQLHQLNGVARDGGKRIVCHRRLALGDGRRKIQQNAVEHDVAVHRANVLVPRTHPRIRQQVVDELLHSRGSIDGIANEFVGVGVQPVLVPPGKQLGVTRHHPQGFLQIMRGHVSEPLQLGIRGGKLTFRFLMLGDLDPQRLVRLFQFLRAFDDALMQFPVEPVNFVRKSMMRTIQHADQHTDAQEYREF